MGKKWIASMFMMVWLLNACAEPRPIVNAPAPEPVVQTVEPARSTESPITSLPAQDSEPPQALPVPPREDRTGFFRHTVSLPGETLSHIALWYTGDVRNWKEIADANPSIKVRNIDIGDTILIPEALVTTRKRMTAEFLTGPVKGADPPKQTNRRDVKTEPAKMKEIDLFGPVDEIETTDNEMEDVHLFAPVEGDGGNQ